MVFIAPLVALGLLPAALGVTVDFDLTIENKVIAPDGFERSAIVVNGIFPGPLIQVQKEDQVNIVTHNALTDPLMRRSYSIHWHGFFQARTSYADGPAFVNQCPVGPNQTFTYNFAMANQSGNFWYHSHLSTQYCDGLRGAFIVYNKDDPLAHLYDVDDESTVITIADWYHVLAPAGQNDFFQTGKVPIADSTLINGVGRYVGGPEVPWAVITVESGKRYRFRFIQISCRPFMTVSIDAHNMTFIEADGIEHDPVEFQNVEIYAAQRISAVVAANQPVNNYWMRAPPTGGNPAGNPNLDPDLARAIVRYVGAPIADPTTENPGGPQLLDNQMHPIAEENPGSLGDGLPDVHITLNITNAINPPFFDVNGISYVSPTVPALLAMLSGAKRPEDLLPSQNIFLVPRNKLIEVTIPGEGAHPFHLHGHTFDVTQISNEGRNFTAPLRRDVYPINGGNTTFRFFTDNPGAWFLHCHIDWHLEVGLAIVFGEAPEDNVEGPQSQITPEDWEQLCPTYDDLPAEVQ